MEKIGRINQYYRAYGFQEALSISDIEEVLKVIGKELIKPAETYSEGESCYKSIRLVIDCGIGEGRKINHRKGNFEFSQLTNVITEIGGIDFVGGGSRYTFSFTTKKGIALFRKFVEEVELEVLAYYLAAAILG